jgi:hypothetical protein
MMLGVMIGLAAVFVVLLLVVLLVPPDAPPGYGYSQRRWWN